MNYFIKVISILFFASLIGCGGSSSPQSTSNSTAICGNKIKESGEFCETSDSTACTSLGVVFSSGTATCRSDCSGYDTSSCGLNTSLQGDRYQHVIPKLRDAEAFDHATCSDGRPFNFRISMSPTKSKDWVVFLAGGGLCDGKSFPCTDRSETLFQPSSLVEAAIPNFVPDDEGITSRKSTINPTFSNANIVFAEYCTNDFWSGTNTTPRTVATGDPAHPTNMSIVYTGRYNVESIFSTLIQYFGLDDKDSKTRVLFTGNSAGAHGMQNTMDVAIEKLPTLAQNKKLWFVSSAGYSLYTWDNLTYSSDGNGLTDLDSTIEVANEWKTKFDPVCSDFVKENGYPEAACMTGYWNYRTATEKHHQRMMIMKNREDQVYMSIHLIPQMSSQNTTEEAEARTEWKNVNTSELANVRWLYSPDDPAIALKDGSVQDNIHGAYTAAVWNFLPSAEFSANTCGASAVTSFREMLTRFWNDSSPDTSSEKYCYDGDAFQVLK